MIVHFGRRAWLMIRFRTEPGVWTQPKAPSMHVVGNSLNVEMSVGLEQKIRIEFENRGPKFHRNYAVRSQKQTLP